MSLLEIALSYARQGWPVFPLEVRGKKPLGYLVHHGLKDATTNERTIRGWWSREPEANIGIPTGIAFDVADYDTSEAMSRFAAICGEHELDPKHLPRAATGGGGRHILWAITGLGNRAGVIPGMDWRGQGGYIVAPGSIHPSGKTYEWIRQPNGSGFPEPPDWLLQLLDPKQPERFAEQYDGVWAPPHDAYIKAGVEAELQAVRTAAEGVRNDTLNRAAFSLGQMVGAGWIQHGYAEAELLAAGLAVGLAHKEVVATIRSGLSAGQEEPRRSPESSLPQGEIRHGSSNGEHPSEPTDQPRFQVLTARQIAELPDPPASDFLVGSILVRKQRLVLGAHTGEGKTSFIGQMIRTVVNGGEFLGMTSAGACSALIIDAEQGIRSIKRQLKRLGIEDCDQIHYLLVPDGLTLDQDVRERLGLEEILAAGKYDVVSADPLYKLHRGGSNEERAAVDLMRVFDTWRERYGFAFCLPVHCRKPAAGAEFSMHEFFGSTAYLRGAEVVLGLQRLNNGYSRLHFFKDRDGDLDVGQNWALLYNQEWGFTRDPNEGKKGRDIVAEIKQLFEDGRWRTVDQIAAPSKEGGLGINKDKVREVLQENPGRKVFAQERNQGKVPEKRNDAVIYMTAITDSDPTE